MDSQTNQNKDTKRRALAKQIGIRFHECDNLVPGGRFIIDPMEQSGYWTDQRVNDIAWWAVATRLIGLSDSRVIDHAWLAHYRDRANETWALITEPYMEIAEANKLAVRATSEMSSAWELNVHVLPPEMGSWNPDGGCVPIVATFTQGYADYFIRKSLLWALNGPCG